MKSSKVFLNLKNARTISLMKSIMKIALNLVRSINVEKTIYNFSGNNIKNPRYYHTIESRRCWVRNATIDKTNLVLWSEGHKHGSTPSVVVTARQVMRNQNET